MPEAKRLRGFKSAVVLATALVGLLAVPGLAAADTQPIFGVWRNPKNTVHVEIKGCGANTCGYVVWASAKAQADARKGGTENLIGLQLLRDFKPDSPDRWRGKVFVPDLRMTFAGTAEVVDAATLKAKGCLIGGLLCKSQTWRRIEVDAD